MFVLVFFFKQKTAYEMRISDWSSDVCSSDLIVQQTATSDVGQTLDGIAMLGQRSQNRFDVNTGRLHDHVFQRTATQLLAGTRIGVGERSEEHTSELQSLMRISYAVFCLKKKKKIHTIYNNHKLETHSQHTLSQTYLNN